MELEPTDEDITPPSPPDEHRVVVTTDAEGVRLDKFLAGALSVSRRRVMDAIEAGQVRVDGKRARKGLALSAGMAVSARLERAPSPPVPQPELPLHIVAEDEAFVVVDKPSGWPSHPLEQGERGTLANALVARFPECATAGGDVREGGLCHRLDAETSGVMVAARSREAWEALRAQFSARTVLKEYLALAAGSVFGPIEINVPIGRDAGHPGRMRAVADERQRERREAREAKTLVEVERRWMGWTLVRCRITTGVTHQIRVHLIHLGSPVAGDDVYGGARPEGLQRMFLHATRLAFDHPKTGERLTFESPLPPSLQRVLDALS